MFLFLFVFLCCLSPVQTIDLYYFVSVLSGFLLFVTGLSDFVVCILWSCCLLCCFVFNFCVFFIPLKKPPKTDTAKTQKTKKQEKTDKCFQLAQLCSQIVFLFLGGGGLKNADFVESTIKIVVSAYFEKGKDQKMSKRLSQNLAQVCCAT